jgi:hypothetical protein
MILRIEDEYLLLILSDMLRESMVWETHTKSLIRS